MIRFNALVLLTTNLCNLRCRHCYPSSGPSFEEMFRFGQNKMMSPEDAEKYIRQIPDLPQVNQLVHIGGGESTLFMEEFKKIVSIGKKYGLKVSMVTNSSWAKDQNKADQFIEELKNRGLTRIEISVSLFHQEQLDVGYSIRAVRASKKHGLNILVRPVVTKTATVAQILKEFPSEDLEGVTIAISKCTPVGRAREAIVHEDFLYEDLTYGGCYKILNLAIRQDGSVYPCCAGSDITQALCLGNAQTESLSGIILRTELDPLLIVLIHYGPRYLAEILAESGGKDFLQREHVSICHLCNDLFINNETAHQIRQVLMNRLQNCHPSEYKKTLFVNT